MRRLVPDNLKLKASIVIACILCACTTTGNEQYLKSVGRIFGTYYAVTYNSDKDLTAEMEAVMDEVGKSLSTFDSASVISRINRNDTAVTADKHFTKVFNKAQEISEITGGAFDITVAPLVNLWGFGFAPASDRDSMQVDSVRKFVGYDKVALVDGKIIKKDSRLMLDASAIAKGYACDVVADFLDSAGVDNYLVDIGGEIVTKGVNPSGAKWKVGISTPDANADYNAVDSIIELSGMAVATSGNYRQFYESDGRKIAHTIDPRSGYPAVNPLLSATVITHDCMTADAYATAFMVIGDTVQIRRIVEAAKDSIRWYGILGD